MKQRFAACLIALCVPAMLQGCAGAVVAGGATAANVVHDRRTAGSFIEDQNIELKAIAAIQNDEDLSQRAHISATSYNQIVLLTGQAPTDNLRHRAESLVRDIERIRKIHNEIELAEPTSFSTRGNDLWLTTKIKAKLFQVKLEEFDPTRVKVVTENGHVFLMGLVTRAEADAATDVARKVRGVERVVRIFEYTN